MFTHTHIYIVNTLHFSAVKDAVHICTNSICSEVCLTLYITL